jgi:hypothetical protein
MLAIRSKLDSYNRLPAQDRMVTGVTNQGKDIAIKHYVFRELNPQVQRVGLVFTPSNVGSSLGLKEQTVTAHERGIAVVPIPFEGPADLDAAAKILKSERVQALQVHTTPATITSRAPIAKLALELALQIPNSIERGAMIRPLTRLGFPSPTTSIEAKSCGCASRIRVSRQALTTDRDVPGLEGRGCSTVATSLRAPPTHPYVEVYCQVS